MPKTSAHEISNTNLAVTNLAVQNLAAQDAASELDPTIVDASVVDPERIERKIDDKMIGERIRALRLKRSMGLVELGKLTGLSASFLSQLETGRVVPTIRNLARIALVFDRDLSCFFKPDRRVSFRRLERKDRIPITRKQKQSAKFVSESLSALIPDRHIVPCLAEFLPNGEQCEFTPNIFAGTEFVYVLEGGLEITASNQRHLLEAGDVVWIDASTSRQYLCHGTNKAKALIVTQHPS